MEHKNCINKSNDKDGFFLASGKLTISRDFQFNNCKKKYPWDSFRKQIRILVIEDSVTSIGNGAFSDCSSLTSITIPNSVTSIDDSAFWNCSSLTSISFLIVSLLLVKVHFLADLIDLYHYSKAVPVS